ncbi:MAG TPA: DUF1015 domain-containing protein [Anaerolineales bacterium]|nr:DUF1015 domain-containing protein [Anaerolineales bacterium]HMX20180.1 DUF1015 domain-containing protein [Anaerolineales bacterium]HMZ43926.1 DUF1015 domain-containing protein [Anaerolineales bacterium]HNA55257.1 DUF1015 domain-containing protein [Anaerolineales bacterium]HNB87534.1 DUF1015 domain-containing protein [Anaerolineales bacterium]
MKIISDIGIQIPQVYLPKPGTDLKKWAVIACDQFTSEPEYWHEVEKIVGDAPSTLNLTFPEVHLEKEGGDQRIQNIQSAMRKYMDDGILQPRDGLIYVERTVAGKTRKGVILCLDLERYDYTKGSSSLIRATEGTIVDRLPPRIKIREGAAMELPHILVLIDDPNHTVIEPLSAAKSKLEKLYDFDLMLDSGHLAGYAVSEEFENKVVEALRGLAKPETFTAKYDIGKDQPVLLFAMGDGNHSLATAKAIWEKMKPQVGMDHPSRYALVEIENVHDEGLEFEPIHRVLFNLKKDLFAELKKTFGDNFSYTEVASGEEMIQKVDSSEGQKQAIGLVGGGRKFGVIEIAHASSNLAVGTIQAFIDSFLKEGGAEKVDYVHGEDVVERLSLQAGNAGFYLAGMHKSDLFKTVILDGALPRKTFSMGEAREKRFYMEARKIS